MAPEPYRAPAERPSLQDSRRAASRPVAAPRDATQSDVTCGTWLENAAPRERRAVGRYVYAAIVVLITMLFVTFWAATR